MAITHVAVANHNETDPATELTITIPASTQIDDILILSLENGGAVDNPTVTDNDTGGNTWALVIEQNGSTDEVTIWWKRATSGTAGKTITASGFTDSCAGSCSVYRGCITSGNPYEQQVGESNGLFDTSMIGITPTVNGAMVCLTVGTGSGNNSITDPSCTDPGALTSRADVGSSGGSGCRIMHASREQTTAAATGDFTWTISTNDSASVAFNLKPAEDESSSSSSSGHSSSSSSSSLSSLSSQSSLSSSSSSGVGDESSSSSS